MAMICLEAGLASDVMIHCTKYTEAREKLKTNERINLSKIMNSSEGIHRVTA